MKTRDERKVFEDEASSWVNSKAKSGGYVEVFAKHAIGSGKSWLRILYGICFNVDAKTSEKNPPRATLFVVAFGEGASIRPGTYWLKRTQGSGQTASRIVLLR